MSCSPARPAETELDVAMTVARLMAAADFNGNPSARCRNGTRNTPPPMPSSAPRPPASTPAPSITNARETVTMGNVAVVGSAPEYKMKQPVSSTLHSASAWTGH
jgi:hypothetical protein